MFEDYFMKMLTVTAFQMLLPLNLIPTFWLSSNESIEGDSSV